MGKPIEMKLNLDGARNLTEFIEEFPVKVAKKALTSAVRGGSTPLLKKTRQLAKTEITKRTGLTAKAVNRKVKTYASGNAISLIGVSRNVEGSYKGRKHVPANVWHILLGGAQPHALGEGSRVERRGKAGKQRGRIHPGFKGRNILAEAVATTRAQVADLVEKKLAEACEKEAAKYRAN